MEQLTSESFDLLRPRLRNIALLAPQGSEEVGNCSPLLAAALLPTPGTCRTKQDEASAHLDNMEAHMDNYFTLPLHSTLASSDVTIPCNMKGWAQPYHKDPSGRIPEVNTDSLQPHEPQTEPKVGMEYNEWLYDLQSNIHEIL